MTLEVPFRAIPSGEDGLRKPFAEMTFRSASSPKPSPSVPIRFPSPVTVTPTAPLPRAMLARGVGPDIVAGHHVLVGRIDHDARAVAVRAVGRDHVALGDIVHAVAVGADAVGMAAVDIDARPAVAQAMQASRVGADVIARHDVVRSPDVHAEAVEQAVDRVELPEMTFRSAASFTPSPSVPIRFVSPETTTPRPFPSARVPVGSVPMKSPSMMLPLRY